MKKFVILLVISLFVSITAFADDNYEFGYGIAWNVFNNGRTYIVNIYDNSPADKAGLKVGDEIVQINGTKIKKNNIIDIKTLLIEDKNTFVIKDHIGNKHQYIIIKDKYKKNIKKNDELFDLYWNRIMPNAPKDLEELLLKSQNFLSVKSLDSKSRRDAINAVQKLGYMQQKKLEFKSNYDLYKKTIKNQDKLKQKLEEVTNKMLADIQRERELEYQRQLMLQQQAMQAQMIRQQQWQNASLNAQRELQRYQENRLRQYEIDMKYAPKFEAPQMQLPQTYNVNLNHNIRYNGF